MIRSFGDRLAEDLYYDRSIRATRSFPPIIRAVVQRKLQYINAATRLDDLKTPPGNQLEALRDDLAGLHSIRINRQWRIVFRWEQGAAEVRIVDYH